MNVEPQPAVGSLEMSGWADPERARARDGGAPYEREYAVSALADACVFVRAAGAAVLERGASDHHPIVLDLAVGAQLFESPVLLAF